MFKKIVAIGSAGMAAALSLLPANAWFGSPFGFGGFGFPFGFGGFGFGFPFGFSSFSSSFAFSSMFNSFGFGGFSPFFF